MKTPIIIALLFLVACTPNDVKDSLKLAGNNRNQLEKVIRHYKKHHKREKLKAAYFLIANMKDKGTFIYDLMDSSGKRIGYNISDYKNTKEENNWLDSMRTVRGQLFEYKKYLPDL